MTSVSKEDRSDTLSVDPMGPLLVGNKTCPTVRPIITVHLQEDFISTTVKTVISVLFYRVGLQDLLTYYIVWV